MQNKFFENRVNSFMTNLDAMKPTEHGVAKILLHSFKITNI